MLVNVSAILSNKNGHFDSFYHLVHFIDTKIIYKGIFIIPDKGCIYTHPLHKFTSNKNDVDLMPKLFILAYFIKLCWIKIMLFAY